MPTFPTQRLNPCLLFLLRWQAGSLLLAPPRKYICIYVLWKKSLKCIVEYNKQRCTLLSVAYMNNYLYIHSQMYIGACTKKLSWKNHMGLLSW